MADRIVLRTPTRRDADDFLAAVRASRAMHRGWVHPPATREAYHAFLERMLVPGQQPFLVCRRDDGAFVGLVNLTNVVLGNFRSGYLGYYGFAGQAGQGLMREGVSAVVRHAFRTMKLHRLEANIQPSNERSIALVRACGFHQEGFSPRYLKIGGRWRDHERWAIVAD